MLMCMSLVDIRTLTVFMNISTKLNLVVVTIQVDLNSTSSQNQNVNRNKEIDCGRFLNDIITNHKENLVKNLRAALFAFCKKNIEKMFLYSPVTTDIICSVTPFFMLVVKDLCMYKLNSMVTAKEANTSKQYLVIKFVNKLVEGVKLKEIINSETPRSAFPFLMVM